MTQVPQDFEIAKFTASSPPFLDESDAVLRSRRAIRRARVSRHPETKNQKRKYDIFRIGESNPELYNIVSHFGQYLEQYQLTPGRRLSIENRRC